MIGIFIILVVCFIVMTSFPFILALRTPKDEQATLVVRSDNVKDPRYFPKAFKEILNKALEKGVFDEFLILSRPEKFVYSEKVKMEPYTPLIGIFRLFSVKNLNFCLQ